LIHFYKRALNCSLPAIGEKCKDAPAIAVT